ncbi:MAG: Insulinase-like:Peptidase M16, C-terminal [uncultured Cytophagales bacterium]|uniref:Insulinase-like:Peptidase M16, C-terminal n=1 Tax=uncultured Cytophagales bacterium TaxID=158755 RepID=A0A6J4M1M5_9SPHI|nr:MAG: Insulinase-like:Peptidase M16, C-terminal [uncultured Cytophagales bacterium]
MKNTRILPFALLALFALLPVLAAAQASEFRLPRYEKVKLKNGLTVYLMEQHEVPLVYVTAVFPAGAVHDGNQAGLAFLTAEALTFGTKKFTKDQIEEQVDFLGASLNAYATTEAAYVASSFAAADADVMLPLLEQVITAPGFDAREVTKRRARLLAELKQAKEKPREVIGAYFAKFLYNDHPYGNPVMGTPEAAAALQAADVQRFYAAHYHPEEAALAVVGDFDMRKMRGKIRKLFGDWQSPGPEAVAAAATSNRDASMPSQRKVLLINKPDATETTFQIGGLGIARNNEDYVAVQVVNTILGGRFTSWLNDELRVNAGLTYGAGSSFNAHRQAGSFAISTFTQTATTGQAVDLALKVYYRLLNEGPDAATLASAKNYIKGQFPPRYETSGQLATLLAEMFLYNFDESFINTFNQKVDALSPERVKEVTRKYFPRENLVFVLIGKADEIRDTVKQYGEITEKQIKEEGF